MHNFLAEMSSVQEKMSPRAVCSASSTCSFLQLCHSTFKTLQIQLLFQFPFFYGVHENLLYFPKHLELQIWFIQICMRKGLVSGIFTHVVDCCIDKNHNLFILKIMVIQPPFLQLVIKDNILSDTDLEIKK